MQHQLTMGEIHTFRGTCGARGVENRRHRIFVKVGEIVIGSRLRQQAFIFAQQRQVGAPRLVVSEADKAFDPGQSGLDLLNQGQEIIMHQHQVVLGVIHGVEHLIRRKANVDRVQHCANHGHRKKTFQVAVAIPVKHGDRIPGLDSGSGQGVGQSVDTLVQGLVAVTQFVGVDDFIARLIASARQ